MKKKKKPMMKVDQFLDQYNGMPWDMQELASTASEVEGELGQKALRFLEAYEEFETILNKIGYEWG